MKCPDCGSEFTVGWRGIGHKGGTLSAKFLEVTWVLFFLTLFSYLFLPLWALILVGLLFVFAIAMEMRIRVECPVCHDHVMTWFWTE